MPPDPFNEVVSLLHRRREEQSRPGNRDPRDVDRVAVLVDGGGMRGVISAAALVAIEDLQFKDAIDGLIASSAGVMNAAYFVSSSATWYYLSIYFDHLASRQFVNFGRPLVGGDILNLDYAFDEVVGSRMPLDLDAVLMAPVPLTIALTVVTPPEPWYVSSFDSVADLREALIAACWLPIARRGVATFRGRATLDGGVLTPDLSTVAAAQGYSHVLHLRTTGRTAGSVPLRRPFQRLVARYLDTLGQGLGAAYFSANNHAAPGDKLSPARTLEVRPGDASLTLKRHEINPSRLLRAAREAYTTTACTLDPTIEPRDVVPRIAIHR